MDVQSEMVRAEARIMIKDMVDTIHQNAIRWDRMMSEHDIKAIVAEEVNIMLEVDDE